MNLAGQSALAGTKRGLSGAAPRANLRNKLDLSGRPQGAPSTAYPRYAILATGPVSAHVKNHTGLGDPNSLKLPSIALYLSL